ncbi:DUF2281 domain-containing protein [bacterium]|nr:DUF2281 domain-containing protein [bacterium]
MKTLEQMIQSLPPQLQEEVRDFAQFLLDREVSRPGQKLRLSWAGGLREFRDRFTAVDLQKNALATWGD